MSTAEAPAAGGTVSDLGETGLLAALAPLLPPSPAALVGVGDDCAVLAAPDGRYCVSTDVLVEGRHFRTDWMSAQQVGRRAAAQNLADVAAMGAVPVALVVGLVLPGDTPVSWVTDLARGLGRACAPLGVGVVGGDLSSGESIVVSVTVMGDLRGRHPVLRGGAHDGDLLVHVGNLGCGAAGLALLEAGYGDADLSGTAARCRELFRVPCPPLEAGPALALAGATAMMDGWRLGAEIHNDDSLSASKLFLMIPEGSLGRDAKMKLLEWFDGYLYKPLKSRIVFHLLNELYRKLAIALEKDDIPELEPVEAGGQGQQNGNVNNFDEDNFFGCKVLVVDDHPVNQKLLKIILEKAHCIVSTANDGEETIDTASSEHFDIIFMDIQMPGINGYEATQILRGKGYSRPIIACTAGSQDNERNLCKSMGLNDIIKKPFNKKQLFEMVKKHYKK